MDARRFETIIGANGLLLAKVGDTYEIKSGNDCLLRFDDSEMGALFLILDCFDSGEPLSRQAIIKENIRGRQKRFAKYVNDTFHAGDIAVNLSCSKQEMRRLLENLRYARNRRGLEPLKYIYIDEPANNGHKYQMLMNGGMSIKDVEKIAKVKAQASTITSVDEYIDRCQHVLQRQSRIKDCYFRYQRSKCKPT